MKGQHDLLLQQALDSGLNVQPDNKGGDLVATVSNRSKSIVIRNGTPRSLIDEAAERFFDDKVETKKVLSTLGIPHPKCFVFQTPDDAGLTVFLQPGAEYVCKPPDLTEGIGVELNITRYEDVRDYWQRNRALSDRFMLEEQVPGSDLRVQVVGGRIVAACTREPAFVIGDGLASLLALVDRHRQKVKSQNPGNSIEVDRATLALIAEQGYTMDSIPNVGARVELKEIANMSQGAIATDVTSRLHSRYQDWVDRLSFKMSTGYYAIDFIARDLDADPMDSAILLEVNARPEWMHHTFSEVRKHDMAKLVMDELFSS